MFVKIDKEKKEKISAYLEKYKDNYGESAIDYLEEQFDDSSMDAQADIILEICDYLNLLEDDQNVYKGFLRNLRNYFLLNQDILEIGGGFFPSLARHIDLAQKSLGKGSITTYDPYLVVSKLGNIRLIKEKFSIETKEEPYDLIIGFAPCDATEIIIQRANQDKKEFSVGLCGCTHFPSHSLYGTYPCVEAWENYIYKIAKETQQDNGELVIDRLKESYEYPYAVITKKFKQVMK